MNNVRLIMVTLFVALCCVCTTLTQTAGGSSQQGNGIVVGRVLDQLGNPVAHARVTLIPSRHNPVVDLSVPDSCSDTTAADGEYRVKVPDSSVGYHLIASDNENVTKTFVSGITIHGDTTHIADAALSLNGAVKIAISDSMDQADGYLYIKGTDRYVFINESNGSGYALINGVPMGSFPALCYGTTKNIVTTIIRRDVKVVSGATVTVFNPSWAFARDLYLNTSASGAAVSGNVYDFPILVRLNAGNFNFQDAQGDGQDILFTKPDGHECPYEIERWDAGKELAEVWVKVDTVHGNDSTRFITMYWGASATSTASVTAQSNGAAVFDTADGFQGVWHLGESGNDSVKDATVNQFNGTSVAATAPVSVSGAVGKAREFNGTSDCITFPNTAAGKLNFSENDTFTVSAWVYSDTIDNTYHAIVSKGNRQYTLQIEQGTGMWEFYNFLNTTGWYAKRGPAQSHSWIYLAGVRNGSLEYFYVNGMPVDTGVVFTADTGDRTSNLNVTIGNIPDNENPRYFNGIIDEVRISNVAYSADWIRLCYMNQTASDKLVTFSR